MQILSDAKRLDSISDEGVTHMIPDMIQVLSQSYLPALRNVLSLMRRRENLFFPYVSDILRSTDGNSKYWVMSQLIPGYTAEHKQALRPELEAICYTPSSADEDMALSDCAEECLVHCFGSL